MSDIYNFYADNRHPENDNLFDALEADMNVDRDLAAVQSALVERIRDSWDNDMLTYYTPVETAFAKIQDATYCFPVAELTGKIKVAKAACELALAKLEASAWHGDAGDGLKREIGNYMVSIDAMLDVSQRVKVSQRCWTSHGREQLTTVDGGATRWLNDYAYSRLIQELRTTGEVPNGIFLD
jgi:hypothetical protein